MIIIRPFPRMTCFGEPSNSLSCDLCGKMVNELASRRGRPKKGRMVAGHCRSCLEKRS